MNVNLDWDGRNYAPLAGFHPLLAFLSGGTAADADGGAAFVVHAYAEKAAAYGAVPHFDELAAVLAANRDNPPFAWNWKFFDAEEQFMTERSAEGIYFCHTFPLTLGLRSFVFYLEDIRSLFLPFASEFGIDAGAADRHAEFETWRKFIGDLLASDKCLAIFCHYQETAAALDALFPELALRAKMRMLDLVSLHREYRGAPPRNETARRKRLLYAHGRHGAADGAAELVAFLEFCRKLAASDLAGRVVPTLILPEREEREIPPDLALDVFRGDLPEDVYASVLAETRFHFNASPALRTGIVLECALYGIVPVVRGHAAYAELGYPEPNLIALGRAARNALALQGAGEPPQVDLEGALAGVRRILDGADGHAVHPAAAPRASGGEDAIARLLQLKQILATLGTAAGSRQAGSRAGVLQPVSPGHFSLRPLRTHAQFNGLVILTDGMRYVYARSDVVPASLRELAQSGRFFRSAGGRPMFDDLTQLDAAVVWAGAGSRARAGLAQKLKFHLSRHKRLYLLVRDGYRELKRVRRIFARPGG